MSAPKVFLVVPCYNEEAVLPETVRQLTAKLDELTAAGKCAADSRILFVDDGSRDATWALILAAHAADGRISGLKLAHNRGHQNALLAGLMAARSVCDCAISLDADLQDDIGVLGEFLDAFADGKEIVYGVRRQRKTDTAFKRSTARAFYKIMKVLGVEVVYDHADYRLMGRRALDALAQYREVNLFLRGIVPTIGFATGTVLYDRRERFAGQSKYPLRKMVAFAAEGITSFSVKPLRIISNLGIVVSAGSIAGLLYALISHFCGLTVPGWTAIVCSIWLLGGIQLLCIGVLGTYIGKLYSEVKDRPRYIVEEFVNSETDAP